MEKFLSSDICIANGAGQSKEPLVFCEENIHGDTCKPRLEEPLFIYPGE